MPILVVVENSCFADTYFDCTCDYWEVVAEVEEDCTLCLAVVVELPYLIVLCKHYGYSSEAVVVHNYDDYSLVVEVCMYYDY